MNSNFVIRAMTPNDIKLIFEWGDEFNWNECDQDLEPFLAIDPKGFFVGELDGQPIASIGAPKYRNYAFIGLYIVKKEFRGKGYGLPLFNHAMDYVKDCEVVGLDAVEKQIPNYEKWGFR